MFVQHSVVHTSTIETRLSILMRRTNRNMRRSCKITKHLIIKIHNNLLFVNNDKELDVCFCVLFFLLEFS